MSQLNEISERHTMPVEFDHHTCEVIKRIEKQHSVIGILYLRDGLPHHSSLPKNMSPVLSSRLPPLTLGIQRAISEIDVLDDFIAYRIETKNVEVLVAGGKDFASVVVMRAGQRKRNRKTKSAW